MGWEIRRNENKLPEKLSRKLIALNISDFVVFYVRNFRCTWLLAKISRSI